MKSGKVILAGAGCGRDLITVRALEALRRADVLLYDDLLDSSLLFETKEDCECIYVGKRRGKHGKTQEAIEELLIQKAREGKDVVRLKGGDSFVFGRGGEEILALQKERIPYEVIPGVTSAVAVPGHAGIPVTHRGTAQSFTVITGHTAAETEENYEVLAGLDGTLVFLMGLQNTAQIAEKLMRFGKPADTAATIISRGFSAEEKRIDGTLADIGEKAGEAETPAILVIGPTAAFHMEPTIRRPLDGVSVTLAGTGRFIRKLDRMLSGLGAETDLRPVLRILPMTEQIPEDPDAYGWIVFTSAQGVTCLFQRLRETGTDIRKLSGIRFACIGTGTAEELALHGIRADLEPEEYTARALGKILAEQAGKDGRILILRAENGSQDLTEELEKAGVPYEDVPVYRTEADPSVFQRPSVRTDYIVFSSGAGVRAYTASCGLPEDTVPVCIGPSTEKVFRSLTGRDCLTAERYTAEGITERILAQEKHKKGGTQI